MISVAITGSSDMHTLDLYVINIFTKSIKTEMHRCYVQAGLLLCVCYCWRSKLLTKI